MPDPLESNSNISIDVEYVTSWNKDADAAKIDVQQINHNKISEEIDLTRSDFKKVIERDEDLLELEYHSMSLEKDALVSEEQTAQYKKTLWWKRSKLAMKILAISIAYIVVIVKLVLTGIRVARPR